METLVLPRDLERALILGHPWVYRNHVPPGFSAPSGTWVEIRAGRFSGYGLWDAESPIAIRVFATERAPDAAWFHERVRDAWALREPLRAAGTSAYRWLFGEGDGLPGVTVDLYGAFATVLTYAPSVAAVLPDLVPALLETAPLKGVVLRAVDSDAAPTAASRLRLLAGRMPPRQLIVEEDGIRYGVDLHQGQKSGLFLDQRENRRTLRELARGRRVLNLFSYTGGFSLAAALGGAAHVTSVDAAGPALEAFEENCRLNGLERGRHTLVSEDAFEYLKEARRLRAAFDLVICDPPSFARRREQLARAKQAYVRLNALALGVTAPYGLYATASCTAQLTREDFVSVLAEAAARARCRLQVFHEAGHAIDHPILSTHPEGRYLKFAVGRVLGPL